MKKLLLLVAAVALLIKFDVIRSPFTTAPDDSRTYNAEVVLYATAWCGYCKKTRSLLAEHGIPYVEYDIEKSSEGLVQYKALNGSGIPLLVVNGDVIRGYNPKQILASASK
ncbi:glutaredoxin family protein [Simiduia agarivorans]|uniref:Glutaredoxin NrdH-like protein n=1 Tax=Simiduia agarivorans (strain DSM 21679 / JCM 13881 / BCRC 17597 / SA1) TaxID=1117647 RepID=K4KJ76_SIMAS|nr:glutaredoxin family protein [Simiduia agarivorans]AFU98240.2 glutaredoxin NrdH-like protein [Simiduia agarivorans SA1 = DSM 21679]